MPTTTEVAATVKEILADKANIPVTAVIESKKLTEYPLTLDSTALGFVALDLRGYIQQSKPANTITVGEVRASGLTVATLITLVNSRV